MARLKRPQFLLNQVSYVALSGMAQIQSFFPDDEHIKELEGKAVLFLLPIVGDGDLEPIVGVIEVSETEARGRTAWISGWVRTPFQFTQDPRIRIRTFDGDFLTKEDIDSLRRAPGHLVRRHGIDYIMTRD